MRRTRTDWSRAVEKMRDPHRERQEHQTYCNRGENLRACPACGCRLSSLADRSYNFVHDFLLVWDRHPCAPLDAEGIFSLTGLMEGCGSAPPGRTLLKATAQNCLTCPAFLPEVLPWRSTRTPNPVSSLPGPKVSTPPALHV